MQAVVDAEHQVDPNFPVELPSVARAESAEARAEEERGQQEREQQEARKAAGNQVKVRSPSYSSSNSEWQNLRKKMYT